MSVRVRVNLTLGFALELKATKDREDESSEEGEEPPEGAAATQPY